MSALNRLNVLAALLTQQSYAWQRETDLQDGIAKVLDRVGLPVSREHRLSERDRPDFLVGDVVIEVKVDGTMQDALRQVERYCQHDAVRAVLLASTRTKHLLTGPAVQDALTWAKPLRTITLRGRFG